MELTDATDGKGKLPGNQFICVTNPTIDKWIQAILCDACLLHPQSATLLFMSRID